MQALKESSLCIHGRVLPSTAKRFPLNYVDYACKNLCSKTVRLLPTAAAASTTNWQGFSAPVSDTRASGTDHVHAGAKNSIKETLLLISANLTVLEIFCSCFVLCVIRKSILGDKVTKIQKKNSSQLLEPGLVLGNILMILADVKIKLCIAGVLVR